MAEKGLAKVERELADGVISVPKGQPEHLFIANRTDNFARLGLKDYAKSLGHGDDLVRVNRRLYLEGESGAFRIPDLYFPRSQTILDLTLGTKKVSAPQIVDFFAATGNNPIYLVRPQSYGGNYILTSTGKLAAKSGG